MMLLTKWRNRKMTKRLPVANLSSCSSGILSVLCSFLLPSSLISNLRHALYRIVTIKSITTAMINDDVSVGSTKWIYSILSTAPWLVPVSAVTAQANCLITKQPHCVLQMNWSRVPLLRYMLCVCLLCCSCLWTEDKCTAGDHLSRSRLWRQYDTQVCHWMYKISQKDIKLCEQTASVYRRLYSWIPITRTFKGNRKRFEISGFRVVEGKISKKLTWRGIEKGSS